MIHYERLYLTLVIILGFFMAWGIGANDVANAIGIPIGSKSIKRSTAVILAVIFEALGALLSGNQVTDTIKNHIVNIHLFADKPETLILGMLASLASAGTWLFLATRKKLPISTTHSIVGALIGFSCVELGMNSVHWNVVIDISLSWIITPIIAGLIAYCLYSSINTFVLSKKRPLKSLKIYMPCYIFLSFFVLSSTTLLKGLSHTIFRTSFNSSLYIAFIISALFTMFSIIFMKHVYREEGVQENSKENFVELDKVFGSFTVFTSCVMAFAHGSNDIANAVGPVAAVVNIIKQHGIISNDMGISVWIMLLGALGIVIGLSTYGHKVISTVGDGITKFTPCKGFAAQLSTAATVVIASGLGLPVSTTQTLIGAILGVAMFQGAYVINFLVVSEIFYSWIVTVPVGGILSIFYYNVLSYTIHVLNSIYPL